MNPAVMNADSASGNDQCPKCGAEGLKQTDDTFECRTPDCGFKAKKYIAGRPLSEDEARELCPGCYLVTWSDQDGLHFRQGVPMKSGVDPRPETSLSVGEPEEC